MEKEYFCLMVRDKTAIASSKSTLRSARCSPTLRFLYKNSKLDTGARFILIYGTT